MDLDAVHVSDLPWGDNDVVVLPSTISAQDGIETLVKHQILSAPVFDSKKHKYIGFFDLSDATKWIVEALQETSAPDAEAPDMFADIRDLLVTCTRLKPSAVDVVASCSETNVWKPVAPTDSLRLVLEKLGDQGAHRVPVVEDDKVTAIVSQSAVVRFLHNSPELMAPLAGLTTDVFAKKDVISLDHTMPALRAFELLIKHKISAIALTEPDEGGKVVATISHSDLKALSSTKKFRFFGITCLEFVERARAVEVHQRQTRPAVITAHADTPVAEVVARLASSGLHRIFVVDDKGRPTNVVSIRDVLALYLKRAMRMSSSRASASK